MTGRVAAVLLLACATAHAGDRRLEVLFVNMTPDVDSSAPSKGCVRGIERHVRADYTQVNRAGETALRKLAGKTAGEPFLEWPAAAFKGARERPEQTWIDAVILVDCRPETRTLDVLVHPASGGLVRLSLRGVPVDGATTAAIASSILRRAWSGFSP
jgi:hypothetical protein